PHQGIVAISVHPVVLRNTAVGDTLECADVETGLALLAFLGGDHDHTIGAPGTVHSRSGSIFKYGNRFDICRIDALDRAGIRDSVNHIKRIVGRVDGTQSPYADRGRSARLPAPAGCLHPWSSARKCVNGIRDGPLLKLIGTDGSGTTGERGAALRTVGNDHHFFQL